ncbi:MAG: hypothetical protein Hyperionvirus6_106 [Hyperionvirus sp.]|uniref:Uncharacterized protein n=1 Tax=Hyperionvirus sp. TaxID=2487770 RepID=A0A3G5A851_9VIRU|nr:MAG: hypothetical protein Hyperionvirus6_106 [Hyperionvirus sp.]
MSLSNFASRWTKPVHGRSTMLSENFASHWPNLVHGGPAKPKEVDLLPQPPTPVRESKAEPSKAAIRIAEYLSLLSEEADRVAYWGCDDLQTLHKLIGGKISALGHLSSSISWDLATERRELHEKEEAEYQEMYETEMDWFAEWCAGEEQDEDEQSCFTTENKSSSVEKPIAERQRKKERSEKSSIRARSRIGQKKEMQKKLAATRALTRRQEDIAQRSDRGDKREPIFEVLSQEAVYADV